MMLKSLLCAAFAALSLGALSKPLLAASDQDWPEITSQTKPWTRWWWLSSIGTKADFSSEMEKYAKAGLGGLEITPIYGVRGQEDRFRQYLSPQWMDLLDHVLDEAQRLDLGVDMATGNGWPFGGPWVDTRDAARHVVTKTYAVKGGERLAENVVAIDQALVRVAGRRRVDISELKDPVSANANLQDLALDQVRFPRKLPLLALVAYAEGRKIDLTDKVDASGRLDWTAPAGDWTLYAVFLGWHGKLVERAGPGGEGDVIDHFSSAALADYLKHFDAAYAGHRPDRLRAYFNDSYEVDDAPGEADWTPRFFEEFKRRRGYELRDELPAFFGKDTEEKNARVMADHRETISDLLLQDFTLPWANWSAKHNALIRNQAHGAPANIVDLYAASGIPETEGTNVVDMKLASSAAHVTGKRLTGAETATWLDEHWVSTLGDVKRRVDLMFLGSVNHVCYHGTAFSPPTEPWPGHQFYASVELNPANPLWTDFAALNSYVARVQSFLQTDRPGNDVLLYYPIHDLWAQRGKGTMPHFPNAGRTGSAQAAAQKLLERGYTFDFITDRLLADVQVRDGALVAGGNRYRVVLVPETKRMPLETLQRLRHLAEAGATIAFHKELPSDVPGLGRLQERRSGFAANIEALRRGASESEGVASASLSKGRLLLGGDLEKLLVRSGVARETLVDLGLRFERRAHAKGYTYFVLNRGDAPFEGWVPLQGETQAAVLFDSLRAERGRAALRIGANGRSEVYLRLGPSGSAIVKTFSTPLDGPDFAYWKPAGDAQPIEGSWALRFVSGGPTLPTSGEMPVLKSWTELDGAEYKAFSGTAVYRLSFPRPSGRAAAWQLDLGTVAESARVTLNGRELAVLFSPPFQLTLSDDRLAAQNTLEIAVTNLAANRIADLDRRDPSWKKFYNIDYPARLANNRGADGNFSAAKWPPRASGLLGPVALTPLERFAPDSAPASVASEVAQRRLSIVEAGAVADGSTVNTVAIQAAIDRLASAGGGTVVVPRGVFVSGALDFKPGVRLHLDKEAVLQASTDPADFPSRPTRIEGRLIDYTPALINADRCDGLRITGEGTLDGSGRKIWDEFWTRRKAASDARNFANTAFPRARLAFVTHSRDVLIEGVTFRNSQFWNCHLYFCQDVVVRNARFVVPDDYRQAPSTDGIDVDSSQDVLVEGCYFSITDDCIALKGTKGPSALEDRSSPPVERIRVRNCVFKRGPAVTLGSEATIVRDVVVENCHVIGPLPVLTFKLRADTPQTYEDIHYRGIVLDSDGGSLVSIRPWRQYINLEGKEPPRSVVRNITISGITGRHGAFGLIEGNPGQTEIDGILFSNIALSLRNDRLGAKDVKNLRFENVTINGAPFAAPSL